MTQVIAIIKSHPVLTYLVLVFGISWGTFFILMAYYVLFTALVYLVIATALWGAMRYRPNEAGRVVQA